MNTATACQLDSSTEQVHSTKITVTDNSRSKIGNGFGTMDVLVVPGVKSHDSYSNKRVSRSLQEIWMSDDFDSMPDCTDFTSNPFRRENEALRRVETIAQTFSRISKKVTESTPKSSNDQSKEKKKHQKIQRNGRLYSDKEKEMECLKDLDRRMQSQRAGRFGLAKSIRSVLYDEGDDVIQQKRRLSMPMNVHNDARMENEIVPVDRKIGFRKDWRSTSVSTLPCMSLGEDNEKISTRRRGGMGSQRQMSVRSEMQDRRNIGPVGRRHSVATSSERGLNVVVHESHIVDKDYAKRSARSGDIARERSFARRFLRSDNLH